VVSAPTPERPERDPQAEQDHAEWRGWMEANAYSTHPDDCEGMAEAFEAGMRAARDLAAPGPAAAPWTVAELAAVLDSFYAWFTVSGGGARVQGQLLGADADEFARALHAGLGSARAHREKGSPA
jgi:hypothetical protein